jgi:rubrerythrin
MQMSPTGGGAGWMHPDQVLQALSPIAEEGMRIFDAGATLPSVMSEAILAAYLVGRGLSARQAMDTVLQWRMAGAPGLVRRQRTPQVTAPGGAAMDAYGTADSTGFWAMSHLRPMGPGPAAEPVAETVPEEAAEGTPEAATEPAEPVEAAEQAAPPVAAAPPAPGSPPEPVTQAPAGAPPLGRPPAAQVEEARRWAASRQQLIQEIEKAMQDQATAAAFYQELMDQAGDPVVKDYINHAREDEIKHYRMLGDLHREIAGRPFDARPQKVEYANLAAGLFRAMNNEYEAMEFYRGIYLRNPEKRVRDVFFELMTDELEHATRFNYALQVLGR